MQHIAKTRHLDRSVGGFTIHYREAGRRSSTGVVLLHGSPSSSFSFREIVPVLGADHYVVAPDMPGFGFSDAPEPDEFEYTFEHLAEIVEEFVADIGLERYVLYVTDFSTPVGYYLATRHPDRVLGIVVQNGNVHEAGLGEAWDTTRRFLDDPSPENRAALPEWLNFEGTRDTYLGGVPDRLVPLYPRESWHLDWERLSQHLDAHFQLFCDYRSHIQRFPAIAEYHRKNQPPCLVLWGRHDIFFDIAEVLAFNAVLDRLEVHVYDGGHFLTESHSAEIAAAVNTFVHDVRESVDA
jgi:pimeloyl-ACP methyl ester carboxylesterase